MSMDRRGMIVSAFWILSKPSLFNPFSLIGVLFIFANYANGLAA